MATYTFETPSGISITREHHNKPLSGEIDELIDALDRKRGIFLTSTYEFPGRYSKWCIGFVDPPIAFSARDRVFEIIALNARGLVLLAAFERTLKGISAIERFARSHDRIEGVIRPPSEFFPEEQRSRQPSFFSVLRGLIEGLACDDHYLGFYGAFGYDLVFQFEDITKRLSREADQRDLVLYLPDRILVEDSGSGAIDLYSYEFTTAEGSTAGLARASEEDPYRDDIGPTVLERTAATRHRSRSRGRRSSAAICSRSFSARPSPRVAAGRRAPSSATSAAPIPLPMAHSSILATANSWSRHRRRCSCA